MKVALLCCWSNMRIYPIYSSNLRTAIEKLTGAKVAALTTDCMCFNRNNPVPQQYDLIRLPYFTRSKTSSRAKNLVKRYLYGPNETLRGRLLSSRSDAYDVIDFQQSSYAFGYESLKSLLEHKSRARKVVTIHKLDEIQKSKPEVNVIYNKADAVIVFSEEMKKIMSGYGVREDLIHAIHHGTSIPALSGATKDQAILFCGSPIPKVKGFEHYVVALRILSERGIRLKTKVYGFFLTDEKEYALKLATEQGVQELLEWQSFADEDELIAEYQKSLVCVIPYTGYGGYFPAAHAMGNGVPIVATDILGHAEYARDCGLLVPPGDAEALASAIERLVADESLRQTYGAAGRARAEHDLSWESVATRTLGVFAEVLAKDR